MRNPLLTPNNTFNRSAIMARAWVLARRDMQAGWTAKDALSSALRFVWAEAKGARSYAIWAAEQDAAAEAAKTLDARTREIRGLHQARVAAIGIESTRMYFAELQAIDGRLAELGA